MSNSHTDCESRTVSWKLTTKTDCDVQLTTQMLSIQCRLYIKYIIYTVLIASGMRDRVQNFCTLTLIPELIKAN